MLETVWTRTGSNQLASKTAEIRKNLYKSCLETGITLELGTTRLLVPGVRRICMGEGFRRKSLIPVWGRRKGLNRVEACQRRPGIRRRWRGCIGVRRSMSFQKNTSHLRNPKTQPYPHHQASSKASQKLKTQRLKSSEKSIQTTVGQPAKYNLLYNPRSTRTSWYRSLKNRTQKWMSHKFLDQKPGQKRVQKSQFRQEILKATDMKMAWVRGMTVRIGSITRVGLRTHFCRFPERSIFPGR